MTYHRRHAYIAHRVKIFVQEVCFHQFSPGPLWFQCLHVLADPTGNLYRDLNMNGYLQFIQFIKLIIAKKFHWWPDGPRTSEIEQCVLCLWNPKMVPSKSRATRCRITIAINFSDLERLYYYLSTHPFQTSIVLVYNGYFVESDRRAKESLNDCSQLFVLTM